MTSEALPSTDDSVSISDSQRLLIESVESVKNRHFVLKLLCSVRSLILLLSFVLAVGMFVVIVLVATSNLWSLVRLSRLTQDITMDVMRTYIDESLREPKMLSLSALSAYKADLIGNDPGGNYILQHTCSVTNLLMLSDNDRQIARNYIYNSHSRAKTSMTGSKLTIAGISMEGGSFSVMGCDGGSSDFYTILFEDWGNFSKIENFMDLYFVVGGLSNIPPAPFISSPSIAFTYMFAYKMPIQAMWLDIFSQDQCTDTPGGKVCAVSIAFMARKLAPDNSLLIATSTIIRSEAIQPSLSEFVTLIPGSVAFIIEYRSGNIFCTSDKNLPVVDANQFPMKQLKGYELNNTLMAAASVEIYKRFGAKFEKLGVGPGKLQQEIFTYKLNGKTQFCGVNVIMDEFGMNFIAVLTGHNQDFIGSSVVFVSTTVVISVLLGIVSMIFGAVCAIVIVMPLSKIVKQIKYLKNMQLEQVTEYPTSAFSEIATIQSTFYVVVGRLREYKAYLPSYVIERDYGILEEETEEAEVKLELSDQLKNGRNSFKKQNSKLSNLVEKSFQSGKQSSDNSRRSSDSSRGRDSFDRKGSQDVDTDRKLTVGLEQRMGAIIYVKIYIPQTLFATNEAIQIYSVLFQAIQTAISVEKGLIVTYDQSEIQVYWEYNDKLASRVARCAMSISECIGKLTKQQSTEVQQIKIYTAAAVGSVMQGSMGTKTKRQFVVFGSACDRAYNLLQIAQEWDTPILISDQILTDTVAKSYVTRPIATFNLSSEMIKVYQITAKNSIQSDEWMYEMQQQNNLNKYESYINAIDHLDKNNVQESLSLLKKQLEATPEDRATLTMVQILEQASLAEMKSVQVSFAKSFDFISARPNPQHL